MSPPDRRPTRTTSTRRRTWRRTASTCSRPSTSGWQDQARELVDEISGRLQHVEDEQARAELATTVEELRAEVDGQARPGAVRGIVTKLGLAIGTAMAGELGSELTQHAFQLLLQLPA